MQIQMRYGHCPLMVTLLKGLMTLKSAFRMQEPHKPERAHAEETDGDNWARLEVWQIIEKL